MKLTRFEVCGYKNFTRPVILEDLGAINILHGDNNIGKSNLLEAMHLFFRMLSEEASGQSIPLNGPREFSDKEFFSRTGHQPAFIFNLVTRDPIDIQARISLQPGELERARLKPMLDASHVEIGLHLEWIDGSISFRVSQFVFADGTDVASGHTRSDTLRFVQRFALFLARNMLVHDQKDRPSFALIDETRRLRSPAGRLDADDGGVIPQSLMKRLYQTRDSLDAVRVNNWKLFAELASSCFPQLEGGEFLTRFDIDQGRADLVWSQGDIRMPVELLGSGVQQALALLGQLLTTDATWVAIEEPECNLSFELQLRLRNAFRRVVDDPSGPSQLFMTSHSPAFEVGDCFYGMRVQDNAPIVERRPIERVNDYLKFDVDRPPHDGRAPLSYVTSDGLVRLPPVVIDRLGVRKGGTILFLDRDDGTVEVLTADEIARRFGDAEDEAQ